MRTSATRVGDIVCCNKRGCLFRAKVGELDADGKLLVEPIERNISCRRIEASGITAHWARSTTTRASRAAKKTQPALELPLAL